MNNIITKEQFIKYLPSIELELYLNNALKIFAKQNQLEIIKMIFVYPYQYNTICDAFIIASKKGFLNIFNFLLDQMPELIYNNKAFVCAVYYGHVNIVKKFIESEINLNIFDDEYGYALSCCSYEFGCDLIMAKLLLENNLNEDHINAGFSTAAIHNQLDIMDLAIDYGANPFHNDNYTLNQIIQNGGKVDALKKLIELGIDIHHKDDFALQISAEFGHTENIKLLIDLGANIHANDDLALVNAIDNKHDEIVKILIHAGANIHARLGMPLRLATQRGNETIVKLLIESGADIHKHNNCPIQMAVRYNHPHIVKLLHQYGYDLHFDDEILLRLACSRGSLEIVRYIIEDGANIHIWLDTPLKIAVMFNHLELVKFFVEKGVDIHSYDNYVIKWANKYNQQEMLKYFLEKDNNVDLEISDSEKDKYEANTNIMFALIHQFIE